MVTVFRTGGWIIRVYGREHGVPHFHVDAVDWRCVIAMETLEVLAGDEPSAAVMKEIRAVAGKRKTELLAIWRRLNP